MFVLFDRIVKAISHNITTKSAVKTKAHEFLLICEKILDLKFVERFQIKWMEFVELRQSEYYY